MKKTIALILWLALTAITFCACGKVDAAQMSIPTTEPVVTAPEKPTGDTNAVPAAEETGVGEEAGIPESAHETDGWLPQGTEVLMSETDPLPELADVIAETYGIPQEELENTGYYYNYVDLNEDGDKEIFVVVRGPYTSGSGGDSAMIVLPYAGMMVSQKFTLMRMPILISDQLTNNVHELVYLRSGGGNAPELVRLTSVDGIYTMTSDAEVLESLEGITGTAILGNDLIDDMASRNFLTLAD